MTIRIIRPGDPRTCMECGDMFPYAGPSVFAHYCSTECRDAFVVRRVLREIRCAHCDKKASRVAATMTVGILYFCTTDCASAFSAGRLARS